jgi:hypothetical protein
MIDFMVICLPRSGSTWAANWLSSGPVFAMHDPLWQLHRRDLDRMLPTFTSAEIRGVACTGLWRWLDFVNAHPARKVILHRPEREVAASLARLGLPPLPDGAAEQLALIEGMHIDHRALFARRHARRIWQHLTGDRVPFDEQRHDRLIEMRIEPHLERVSRRPIDQ